MKRRTEEWIRKAEGDRSIAQREMGTSTPVWDGICFHAQQCAEKYLKAFLEENNIPFGKIHALTVLLDAAGGMLSELDPLRPKLAHLSILGIAARYPGTQADRRAAEEAMETAEEVRTVVRRKLGLP